MLSNARREKFAQSLVAGMNPETAYALAGFKPHRQNAHRMMTQDDILARVSQLQAPAIKAIQWDFKTRMELLRETALAAREAGDHRAVIAAIAESNRMEGVYRRSPTDPGVSEAHAQINEMLRRVVASKAALPIGDAGRRAAELAGKPSLGYASRLAGLAQASDPE